MEQRKPDSRGEDVGQPGVPFSIGSSAQFLWDVLCVPLLAVKIHQAKF